MTDVTVCQHCGRQYRGQGDRCRHTPIDLMRVTQTKFEEKTTDSPLVPVMVWVQGDYDGETWFRPYRLTTVKTVELDREIETKQARLAELAEEIRAAGRQLGGLRTKIKHEGVAGE